jgi:putative membrane protein
MKHTLYMVGLAVLAAAWGIAAMGHTMTSHMVAHMTAIAIAAPLLASGIAGTRLDPAVHWPQLISPLPMSLLELLVVWGWHVPTARAFAAESITGLALEQAMFAAAGLLLWSACLRARATGVIALLLTTMHMTLLGALITLAPRTLFDTHGFTGFGMTLSPLADQQLSGVIMLLIGGCSYLLGGLALLFRLLRNDRPGAAGLWF